jgi:hypothetical protein
MLLYVTIAVGELHFFCSVSSLHEFPTNKIAEQGRLIFLRENFEVFIPNWFFEKTLFHVQYTAELFFRNKSAWIMEF